MSRKSKKQDKSFVMMKIESMHNHRNIWQSYFYDYFFDDFIRLDDFIVHQISNQYDSKTRKYQKLF